MLGYANSFLQWKNRETLPKSQNKTQDRLSYWRSPIPWSLFPANSLGISPQILVWIGEESGTSTCRRGACRKDWALICLWQWENMAAWRKTLRRNWNWQIKSKWERINIQLVVNLPKVLDCPNNLIGIVHQMFFFCCIVHGSQASQSGHMRQYQTSKNNTITGNCGQKWFDWFIWKNLGNRQWILAFKLLLSADISFQWN